MMWEPRSDVPSEGRRYGLGFWLDPAGPAVLLEGSDAGVSFRSMLVPDQCTFTVISNISNGAWTVAGELEHLLIASPSPVTCGPIGVRSAAQTRNQTASSIPTDFRQLRGGQVTAR
jgi:hypothetical protein